MDYFLIKQPETISIPKPPKSAPFTPDEPSIRILTPGFFSDTPAPSPKTINLNNLDKFDYIANEHLLSSRLKQLFEQYLPPQPWRPCVFVNPEKKDQRTFWFLPALPYTPKRVDTASNGIPCAIYADEPDFARKSPGIFCVHGSKGASYLIVHLSVAESILRRGICGLELVRLHG